MNTPMTEEKLGGAYFHARRLAQLMREFNEALTLAREAGAFVDRAEFEWADDKVESDLVRIHLGTAIAVSGTGRASE